MTRDEFEDLVREYGGLNYDLGDYMDSLAARAKAKRELASCFEQIMAEWDRLNACDNDNCQNHKESDE